MTTITASKINNCQGCGSNDVSLYHVRNKIFPDYFFVRCEKCILESEYENSPEAAIVDWNGGDAE